MRSRDSVSGKPTEVEKKGETVSNKQPDKWAKGLGHAAVGVAAAVIVGKVLVKATQDQVPAAIFAAIVAMFLHDALDAPVSQVLSDFGL
jgi:hypothetical protein